MVHRMGDAYLTHGLMTRNSGLDDVHVRREGAHGR